MTLLILQCGFLGFLLVLSAFFSSSEIAYFSLDPHQIDRIKKARALAGKRIELLLSNPRRLLSTILIGNTIINIGASIYAYHLIRSMFPAYGEWLTVLAMTLLLLVFGEFLPKRIAMFWPERTAMFYAIPLTTISFLLTPLRLLLEFISEQLKHLFAPPRPGISTEEYSTLLDVGGQSGVIDHQEALMAQAIVQLETKYVSQIMTPRVDIQGIDLNTEKARAVEIAEQHRLRYLVLYKENMDHIVGLLDVRTFLMDPNHDIPAATYTPAYVPEQCTLDRLLTRFLSQKLRAAIVVDEYGGTAGFINRGDILEEITGEIADEHADAQLFEQLTDRAWLVDGNYDLDEVAQKTGLPFSSEEGADLLSGWIYETCGGVPREGTLIHQPNFDVRVHQMRRNRITMVVIEKSEAQEEPAS